MSLNITESEYLALGTDAKDAVWISNLLKELRYNCVLLPIVIDNQSTTQLTSNPEFHLRTKHLDVCHDCVRELVKCGLISIAYVPTDENVSDILNKTLAKPKMVKLCPMLGLYNVSNVSASAGVECGALAVEILSTAHRYND